LKNSNHRINHWCNRLLSLGGRYVLVKAVLESLPVYWLALAHIPLSVLNKIRQLVFSFLWSGNKKSRSYHLCNWETVSKPKLYGGWGLRNIFIFYRALASNTLWRVLTKIGIWNRVIKDKYLPYESVHTWLRSASAGSTYGSQTWKNLINSLPLVLQWLAWNPGTGQSIVIGKDVILGMGKDSFLTKELVDRLNQKNVHLLYQASCDLLQGTLCSTWLDCTTLELEGDLALEWEKYRKLLISSGIHLQDRPDVLLWTGVIILDN
jgi:hypothetical protein